MLSFASSKRVSKLSTSQVSKQSALLYILELRDEWGRTILGFAVCVGSVELVRKIASACDFAAGKDSLTPLMIAARRGDPEIVKFLLETKKIAPFEKDCNGWSILHWAVVGWTGRNETEALEVILNWLNSSVPLLSDWINDSAPSAVELAFQLGKEKPALLLMSFGGRCPSSDFVSGRLNMTEWVRAAADVSDRISKLAARGDEEGVNAIIDAQPEDDKIWSVLYGHVSTLEILLTNKQDPRRLLLKQPIPDNNKTALLINEANLANSLLLAAIKQSDPEKVR